jgi:hypothetical protein
MSRLADAGEHAESGHQLSFQAVSCALGFLCFSRTSRLSTLSTPGYKRRQLQSYPWGCLKTSQRVLQGAGPGAGCRTRRRPRRQLGRSGRVPAEGGEGLPVFHRGARRPRAWGGVRDDEASAAWPNVGAGNAWLTGPLLFAAGNAYRSRMPATTDIPAQPHGRPRADRACRRESGISCGNTGGGSGVAGLLAGHAERGVDGADGPVQLAADRRRSGTRAGSVWSATGW